MPIYHGHVPTEAPTPAAALSLVLRRLRGLTRSVWRPTGWALRRWALAAVAVNVAIVASGGAVRLTESGLGCPTWPRCTEDSMVPVPRPGTAPLHMAIEFSNRMLTYVVLAVVLCCFVAALRLTPRRRGLAWLAAALPAGVLAQAALGGMTVLTGLRPTLVAAHYLVSAALLAAAVTLYERAAEGDGPPRPHVRTEIRWLARALLVAVGAVLILGTAVTGTGPHGGDPDAPRFGFTIPEVTQLHSSAAWAALALAVVMLAALRASGAARPAQRAAAVLLGLEVIQAAVGYTQYALELPEGLVWLHLLGSVLVWIAAWHLSFTLRTRGPGPDAPRTARPAATAA